MSTSQTTPAFDPERYKQTTREQWRQAAEAWHRWDSTLGRRLGEATAHIAAFAARRIPRRRVGSSEHRPVSPS